MALTRLLDPEDVLRKQIVAFVNRGEFGLASDPTGGGYRRVWWKTIVPPEEVAFDDNTFLLLPAIAAKLSQSPAAPAPAAGPEPPPQEPLVLTPPSQGGSGLPTAAQSVQVRLTGSIPPEQWNKIGTRLIPRLRAAGQDQARLPSLRSTSDMGSFASCGDGVIMVPVGRYAIRIVTPRHAVGEQGEAREGRE